MPPYSCSDYWHPNDIVHAVLVTNGVVYIGGWFSAVMPPNAQAAALVDSFSGVPASEFPPINGPVNAAIPDNAGGWFLGGMFTIVGALERANLVHIRSDGSVDPGWQPDPDGVVWALALHENLLYVGGGFTSLGGAPRSFIGSLDANTGAVTGWDPNGEIKDPIKFEQAIGVHAIIRDHGLMYVAGSFDR